MSTRLFTYGDTKTVPKQNEWLPGVFATTWGVNLNAPAYKDASLSIEYGEIVKLSSIGLVGNATYKAERAEAGATSFGVILRTTDGQIGMEDDWVERPRSAQTLSVYPLASPNTFKIAVPVESGQTPVVGNDVYVSINTDVEGSVRTDVTTGIALTGWVFASEKYQPTKGAGYAVIIERTV